MRIKYGLCDNNIDITDYCMTKLCKNNIIRIPTHDGLRADLLTDPLPGILKVIIIEDDNGITTEYDNKNIITINTLNNSVSITTDNELNKIAIDKLANIHSKLTIRHGSLKDEYNEQRIAVRYLKGNEKVLEIGGNIGRNSLVIASIINGNKDNMVVLESDPESAIKLAENRVINNMNFNIESSALSKRKLIQNGWITLPSEKLENGYSWVNTITLNDLRKKYKINFDTLILDCEGAFYYILLDMPEILENIKLIIMENDYIDIIHKKYVDNILKINNFYIDYFEAGGWDYIPGHKHFCYGHFYEVWKKK